MKLIVCVSNDNGMMFNNRRQSRDQKLIQRILDITKDGDLVIHDYSQKLFPEKSVCVSDYPCLTNCDYAFVEDPKLIPIDMVFDAIFLCKWNRDYPSDAFFKLDMSKYNLVLTEEFIGSSHDEIIIEKHERKRDMKNEENEK